MSKFIDILTHSAVQREHFGAEFPHNLLRELSTKVGGLSVGSYDHEASLTEPRIKGFDMAAASLKQLLGVALPETKVIDGKVEKVPFVLDLSDPDGRFAAFKMTIETLGPELGFDVHPEALLSDSGSVIYVANDTRGYGLVVRHYDTFAEVPVKPDGLRIPDDQEVAVFSIAQHVLAH